VLQTAVWFGGALSVLDGQLQKEQAKTHSRDSSVGTVTRLRAMRTTNRRSIPDRNGDFLSPKCPVRLSDPRWLERDYFLGVKLLEPEFYI